MDAKCLQKAIDVRRKTHGDRHVGNRVLQNQIPADDPSHQFSKRRIGVCVRASGDGDHRSEFGVTQARETANDGNQEK